jgi:hypothetical protein
MSYDKRITNILDMLANSIVKTHRVGVDFDPNDQQSIIDAHDYTINIKGKDVPVHPMVYNGMIEIKRGGL